MWNAAFTMILVMSSPAWGSMKAKRGSSTPAWEHSTLGLPFQLQNRDAVKADPEAEVPIVGASSPGDSLKTQYQVSLTKTTPSYNLYSPGFPDDFYPPNVQVYYDVQVNLEDAVAQEGARILITFEMFQLQVSDFCAQDGLEIFEPNFQTRVYCASQSGLRILTEGSSFRMRFFSDDSGQERGFSIRVDLYQSPCAQNFVGVSQGSISTPKFPRDYANYELCVWRIEVAAGKRVRLGFNELFDIEGRFPDCLNDALTISKVGDLMKESERYCGKQAPGEIISTGNVMVLKFTSDCCQQNRGFSASFSTVDGAPEPTQEPDIPVTNCACGEENSVEERIVDGEDVSPPHRFPWMLGLVDSKESVQCGAALISRRYALTAAHCAVAPELAPDQAKVLIGSFDLTDADKNYGSIDRYIVHPNFNRKTYANDVALVKMADDVQFNHDVRPLCLPNPSFDTKNMQGVVCGWGSLDEAGTEHSNTLKMVELPTLPLPTCKQKYGTAITDGHLCAGGEKKDACQGDSGGPLFSFVDDRWMAIGIVSSGIGCGREGYPGIFMNVPSYSDWIDLNTQDFPACEASQPQGPIQPNIQNCGLATRHIESRIVGGMPSQSDYPWTAFILVSYTSNGVKTTYNGVGVLISPTYVITALNWMQQWFPQYPELFEVQLGRYDLSKDESVVMRSYKVSKVIPHPDYQATARYDNDLVLLELTSEVNEVFRPVCLPATIQVSDGADATAIGWGRTDTGAYNYVLQEIQLQTVNRDQCIKTYSRQNKVTKKMVCAGGNRRGMCQGDAGSPLMVEKNGRYYLFGLASFGSTSGCAQQGVPDVYSSIPASLDWIGSVTGLQVS